MSDLILVQQSLSILQRMEVILLAQHLSSATTALPEKCFISFAICHPHKIHPSPSQSFVFPLGWILAHLATLSSPHRSHLSLSMEETPGPTEEGSCSAASVFKTHLFWSWNAHPAFLSHPPRRRPGPRLKAGSLSTRALFS